jgi:hypothetical protein
MRYTTIFLGTKLLDRRISSGYNFFDAVKIKLFNLIILELSFNTKDNEHVFNLVVLGISLYIAWCD